MIGVHGGAPAAKILNLEVPHDVKKAILQRISIFPGVLYTPKAAHGSAPDARPRTSAHATKNRTSKVACLLLESMILP
jgi:hypothetical protein